MDDTQTRKLRFILGFATFFVGLWFMWNTSLVYPLKIFVVLLHEISHGIASVLTGGTIERITLDPRQGGACYCGGGNAFLTLSAGYLGSLLWGGAMFSEDGEVTFDSPETRAAFQFIDEPAPIARDRILVGRVVDLVDHLRRVGAKVEELLIAGCRIVDVLLVPISDELHTGVQGFQR